MDKEWNIYDSSGQTIKAVVRKLTYNGQYKSDRYITATISSAYPVNFEIGDILYYRSEPYTLENIPAMKRQGALGSSGSAVVYESVRFKSTIADLQATQFTDLVPSDNQMHYTMLGTFSFYVSSLSDFGQRIQACLDNKYGEGVWTVAYGAGLIAKDFSMDISQNTSIWNAIADFSNKSKTNYTVVGRTITLGWVQSVVGSVFTYSKGHGLTGLTQVIDSDQNIITRLKVYGSDRNMPYRYYNTLEGVDAALASMYVPRLMLPGFGLTSLQSWVNSHLSDETYGTRLTALVNAGFTFSTNKNSPCIFSPNLSIYGERDGEVIFDGSDEEWDEIFPTTSGSTIRSAQIINDNGQCSIYTEGDFEAGTVDTNGVTMVRTFYISIPDIGFNLWDYRIDGETPIIEITSGMCQSDHGKFEIVSCSEVSLGGYYTLTVHRVYDSALNLFYPNSNYQVSSGDSFILTGIAMPTSLIEKASVELLLQACEYLLDNDHDRPTYQPEIDNIFMAEHPEVSLNLTEGMKLTFSDAELGIVEQSVTISQLVIKEGDFGSNYENIPKYEIALSDDVEASFMDKVDARIHAASADYSYLLTNMRNQINNKLSRVSDDTALGHISFKQGIDVTGDVVVNDAAGNAKVSVTDDGDITAEGQVTAGAASFGKESTEDVGMPVVGMGHDATQSQHGGFGGWVDSKGNANFKSITARDYIATYVFRFNKIQVTEGEQWDTNAFGAIQSVAISPGTNRGTATLELDPKEWASIQVGDICRGIFNVFDGMTADMLDKYATKTGEDITDNPSGYNYEWQLPDAYDSAATYTAGDGDTEADRVIYDGYIWRCIEDVATAEAWDESHWEKVSPVARGVDDAGFPIRSFYYSTYFVILSVTNNAPGECTFEYETREGYPHPCDGMKFVQYGNAGDTARQASRMRVISPQSYEQVLTGVSGWTYSSANIAIAYGWLEGMIVKIWRRNYVQRTSVIEDTELHGFGFYARNNIYFGEAIQQIDPAAVEEMVKEVAEYSVSLSEHVNTISVDGDGKIIGGLWTDTEEGGVTYRTYRLQSAIEVRKNGELLTLAEEGEDPSTGTFTIETIQGIRCTALRDGTTLIISAIDNLFVDTAPSDHDYAAMKAMENCRIDFVVNCEGSTSVVKSFPVGITHVEDAVTVSLNPTSISFQCKSDGTSKDDSVQQVAIQMYRGNTSISHTSVVASASNCFAWIDASNGNIVNVSTGAAWKRGSIVYYTRKPYPGVAVGDAVYGSGGIEEGSVVEVGASYIVISGMLGRPFTYAGGQSLHNLATGGNVVLTVTGGHETRSITLPVSGNMNGALGPMLYPAGSWSASATYSAEDDKVPYVLYTDGNYYYLIATSASGSSQSPANSRYWRLVSQIDVIFAKFGIMDYGKMASSIFCGDWMYSHHGRLHVFDSSTSTLTTYFVDDVSHDTDSGHYRYDELYNDKVPYAYFNPTYPDGVGPTVGDYVLFEPEYAVDYLKGKSYMNAAVLRSGFLTGFHRSVPTDINPSNIAAFLDTNGWIEAGTSAVPGASPVASDPTPRLNLNRIGSSVFIHGSMTADYCLHLPFIWADPSGHTFASQVESAGKDVIRELMRVRSYVGEEIEIINLTDETVRIVGLISSITGITHGWNGSTWTAGAPWQTFFLARGCMIRLRCTRENTFTNPFASNSDADASNERIAWELIAILKGLDSTNSYDARYINSIDD